MTTPDGCIPCLIQQATGTIKLSTSDEAWRQDILRDVLHIIGSDCHRHPPHTLMQHVHRFIRSTTGRDDPWRQRNHADLTVALAMFPDLQWWIEHAHDPFATAVLVAIAGNGLAVEDDSRMNLFGLSKIMRGMLWTRRSAAIRRLKSDIAAAGSIVYLADTVCETPFDRLLIERMPLDRIVYVVKARPIGRVATMTDAHAAGIGDLVEVIDDGFDIPGAAPGECSRTFRDRFNSADLIVAKGWNHYVTFSKNQKNVYFLLRANCAEIANSLGCALGGLVLRPVAPRSDAGADHTRRCTDTPAIVRAESQQAT